MRTFEVGKRYGEHAVVFEIVKRTAKTITYVRNWDGREVFFAGSQTVEA